MLNPLPTESIPPPLLFNIKSRTNDGDWTETNKYEIVNEQIQLTQFFIENTNQMNHHKRGLFCFNRKGSDYIRLFLKNNLKSDATKCKMNNDN